MMRCHIYWLFVAVTLAMSTVLCFAAPKPAASQTKGIWTVDVEFSHPNMIKMTLPGESEPKRFWYTIATVTNNNNVDAEFYPRFELMTDTFEIIGSDKEVRACVEEQIKKRHIRRYPLLETVNEAGNRILQGLDNAKDIVIIWPDFDSEAKTVKFFLSGFSNETAVILNPDERDDEDRPEKIVLRKTLELSYSVLGDPKLRDNIKLNFERNRWVMR